MRRVLIVILLGSAAEAIGGIVGAAYLERLGIFVCLAIGLFFLVEGPSTM